MIRRRSTCFCREGGRISGETLQEAAVREAYEESGYQVSFLPLYKYTHQPPSPADPLAVTRPDTEPFYMTVMTWEPRVRNGKVVDSGGEYFISWFMGQIEENAIHHENTGMPDEQNYKSYIVTFEEALACLPKPEANVVRYAQHVWTAHLEYLREREMELSDPSHMLNAGLEASMGNVSLGD
ncbi:hypothetical protein BT96DRAFT_318236 [Gymnopus androsaceus JB14]|uniref:Nudix hydrolase domain-containing protein n=1 Tax=Gymnopus androsaceus JB14 TaxID=1447944 RepID=A0A6A4GZE8_9AGAR|nr:hypothetical protein BT96DRAFT_318236 [Gymnopus androsaceus JB14]